MGGNYIYMFSSVYLHGRGVPIYVSTDRAEVINHGLRLLRTYSDDLPDPRGNYVLTTWHNGGAWHNGGGLIRADSIFARESILGYMHG
jgi:hypothetical protein